MLQDNYYKQIDRGLKPAVYHPILLKLYEDSNKIEIKDIF